MALVVLVLGIVAVATLAMRRAPLWQWALAFAVLGALTRIVIDSTGLWLATDAVGWFFALLPGIVLGLLAIPALRQLVLTGPAYGMVKKILPRGARPPPAARPAAPRRGGGGKF